MMYYTYMLRCENNSIYTGMTTDLERRLEEHKSKSEKCAKYTLNHTAIKFEAAWESSTRSLASKLEYRLKTLTKAQKESIINNTSDLSAMPCDKIESEEYKRVK